MVLCMPYNLTISLKNKSAICDASLVLGQAMKCAILENLSTTTKTESLPLLVLSNPKTKSIEISVQDSLGIRKEVYKL